ncbi:hypothetical protein [Streptomyces sp. DW26H14]|uniref:hypothetical protein n=1 Tax=Streptomyces sp. DW26H14 TaxID=3435395 RepID=UPI00403E2CF2
MNTPVPPDPEPRRDPLAAGDPGPEITYAECRQCGTLIAGLDGRYSCGVCGWVNHHSEGHGPLPPAEDDRYRTPGGDANQLG